MPARRLRISGRVQGVNYRRGLQAEAIAIGVDGWVRNRHDGTVEAHVQGPPDAIERLIDWTRRGPPGAHVVGVDVSVADESSLAGFELRPTA